jgi:chromosome segregation ATPase
MTETLMMQTDLDRLAERVEKAAALIQQLREDRGRLEGERNLLSERVQELESKLQGQDVPALIQEVSALRRAEREWENERRDVASRVESLVKKLEKLEA